MNIPDIKRLLSTVMLMVCAQTCLAGGQKIVTFNPEGVVAPYKNRFSHGKLIPPGATWLYTAGQTGIGPEGEMREGIEAQADQVMLNLKAIVDQAGMGPGDVVKMTMYYLDPADLPTIVAARNQHFGEDFRPASTAVGISALARPGLLLEVELVAAKVFEH